MYVDLVHFSVKFGESEVLKAIFSKGFVFVFGQYYKYCHFSKNMED